MSGVIARPCRHPRCPGLVTEDGKRYCAAHASEEPPPFSRKRLERNPLYATAAWLRARGGKLAMTPLCEDCADAQRTASATDVHHIIPARERPDLALELGNLRSLCAQCHSARSQAEATAARRR